MNQLNGNETRLFMAFIIVKRIIIKKYALIKEKMWNHNISVGIRISVLSCREIFNSVAVKFAFFSNYQRNGKIDETLFRKQNIARHVKDICVNLICGIRRNSSATRSLLVMENSLEPTGRKRAFFELAAKFIFENGDFLLLR